MPLSNDGKLARRREKKVLKAMETIWLLGNSEQRAAVKLLMMRAAKGPHPSHKTRMSDASTFDEICVNCSATDRVPGGWGNLALPCSQPTVKPQRAVRP